VAAPGDRRASRTRLESADLRGAWADHAAEWIEWARAPGHDSYAQFHKEAFLPLLPAPGRKTLDLGCGEGRVSNDLAGLGHRVVGIDRSAEMIEAARAAYPEIAFEVADAASLPFRDESFDCVVAFMSLHDTDDLEAAIGECGRVLREGGRLCFAIIHPLNSAGWFDDVTADAGFVIEGSYLDESFYEHSRARDGLTMTFVSKHRPLQSYSDALAGAGFLIESIRESGVPDTVLREPAPRWRRIPLFLHCRAVKAELPGNARA
jgi:SAM-dependent methyltransferase